MKSITLSRGKCALVDDGDFEWLNSMTWFARRNGGCWYAGRTVKTATKVIHVKMHELLLGAPPRPGLEPDHRDRNGLNNQRGNLRWATHQQNCQNRRLPNKTGMKGVSLTRAGRFASRICIDGRLRQLGTFSTIDQAAMAYDAAARRYFGEFACLNFSSPSKQKKDP